jgi:hypothetical protein
MGIRKINYEAAQRRHDRYYAPIQHALDRANDLALQVTMKALILAAIVLAAGILVQLLLPVAEWLTDLAVV